MEIHSSNEGSLAIVTLKGRLTVNDEPGELKKAVTIAVTGGATTVVIDLSQVPYIDSTRLGELIAAHITVTRQRGRLVLAASTPRITELLTIAGLEGIFEMFASVDAALKSLKS